MKAIKTKYHGPGTVRGSYVSASDEDKNRITISWDSGLRSEENHIAAVKTLCKKMNWHGELTMGSLDDCYVFVFTPVNLTPSRFKV